MYRHYNRIDDYIEEHLNEYFAMVVEMYNNPEIGFEEFKTQTDV